MGVIGLFLNWLLSHLVALGFLGFLLAGLLLRESFVGDVTEVETVDSTPAVPAEEAPAANKQPVGSPVPVPSGPGEKSRGGDSQPAEAHPQPGPVRHLSPGPSQVPDSVFRPAGDDSEYAQPFQPAEVAHFRNPDKQPVIEDNEALRKTQLRLNLARDAFSKEDYRAAESLYLQYLAERPEDAVAFSELGNLYRVMGRERDALDAYYEAALRFRGQGDAAEVKQLQGILERAGDRRATALAGKAG